MADVKQEQGMNMRNASQKAWRRVWPAGWALLMLGLAGCGGSGSIFNQGLTGGGGTNNPAPTVTSVTPAAVTVGTQAQVVTISGTGFVASSTVSFGGNPQAATFVSATQLTIALTAAQLAGVGSFPIAVTNPAPGGGTSTAVNFVVQNPIPAIASLSPASLVAGAAAQTLTVTGTGFVNGSSVSFNGTPRATTFVSNTQLSIALNATDLAVAGSFPVVVTSPAPGGGASAAASFTVNNVVPVASSLTPAALVAGAPGQLLTVNGNGFNSTSVVSVNGAARATTLVSPTQLTIQLQTSDLAATGSLVILVSNPPPGGGNSNSLTLTISAANNPTPVITSLSPASIPVGAAAQTLIINGTGFVNTSVASFNGSNRTTTFVTATQLTIPLSASDVANPTSLSVSVSNPAPGGGLSNVLLLQVTNPVPSFTSVTPSSVFANSGDQVLTLGGSSFVSGSSVTFNGTKLATTFVSATQLTALLPNSLIALPGTVPLSVLNPAPGGGSASLNFTIVNPALHVSAIMPAMAPTKTASQLVILNVGGFVPSVTSVTFSGIVHPATVITPGQISITLSATDLATAGVFPIQLSNPAPNASASNSLYFTVGAPASVAGPISVVAEAVTSGAATQTLDVAFVPMPCTQTSGGACDGQVAILKADNLDLPYLPIDGLVTTLLPPLPPGKTPQPGEPSFITATSAVLNIIDLGTSYTPNFTAYDPKDGVVLVGSITSNIIKVIATANVPGYSYSDPRIHTVIASYTIPTGTPLTFSDGNCLVCGLTVDPSGLPGRGFALASTSAGYVRFNPLDGTGASVVAATVGENFGYDYSPTVFGVLSPFYKTNGVAGLQFVDLHNSGTAVTLSNPVGLRPDSAVIDPSSQLSVVPDEGTGVNTILNLAGLSTVPSGPTTVPSSTYTIPSGVYCALRPDWTALSLDVNTHLLFQVQEQAPCVAVAQLPTAPIVDASNNPTLPSPPSALQFGRLTAPTRPYISAPPFGTILPGSDPDLQGWSTTGVTVYTSVLTGKPVGLVLEQPTFALPGAPGTPTTPEAHQWVAQLNIGDFVSFAGGLAKVVNGEVAPSDMAVITSFIRIY